MTHAWCQNIERDEAVRAAEDNRQGPLPTLDECIERQTARPCGGTDPAPLGGEPGGAVHGLRTERVTLEVTHHCRFPLSEWLLDMVADCTSDPGESVRVVDESAPAASGAAGTEPDAWGVRRKGGVDAVIHRLFRSSAEASAEQYGGTVIPLYAAPQPASGWLTPEEREAILYLIANRSQFAPQTPHEERRNAASRVCHDLLDRSTPPEVVLPVSWREAAGDVMSADEVRAALAAAGVTVKEVGR